MKKFLLILIPILLAGTAFYFFFKQNTSTPSVVENNNPSNVTFSPLGRGGSAPVATPGAEPDPNTGITQTPIQGQDSNLPRLMKLTTTPVGGFMASTTASSTLARYVDRGAGHVYEVSTLNKNIAQKLTNTTVPRVYQSFWNKNLSAAVFRYIKDETGIITNFYAEIRPFKTSASSTPEIPAEIKGRFMSSTIREVAVSPKGDRIFTWSVENEKGVGYISNFDETKKVKVIEAPMTLVNIDWPEENTVTVSPKASGVASGHFYTINLKKPALIKPIPTGTGLTAKLSADTKHIIYSNSLGRGFSTNLYTAKDSSLQDVVFRTTTEKCVWSKLHPAEIYCAVPTDFPVGVYPDDWYRGNISFVDQLWHLDTVTGEVHLLVNPLLEANELVDAINLTLDPKENYLYFMNKRDLTLWSLNLNEE